MDVKTDERGLGLGTGGEAAMARREILDRSALRSAKGSDGEVERAAADEPAAKVDARLGRLASAIDPGNRVGQELDGPAAARAHTLLTVSQMLEQPDQARAAQAKLPPRAAYLLLRE